MSRFFLCNYFLKIIFIIGGLQSVDFALIFGLGNSFNRSIEVFWIATKTANKYCKIKECCTYARCVKSHGESQKIFPFLTDRFTTLDTTFAANDIIKKLLVIQTLHNLAAIYTHISSLTSSFSPPSDNSTCWFSIQQVQLW